MVTDLDSAVKEIEDKLQRELSKLGVIYRLFSRSKPEEAIKEKIERKDYSNTGKKLQDAIGFRIALYFKDDIDIVKEVLPNLFTIDNSEVDDPQDSVFEPQRINFVCRVPHKQEKYFEGLMNSYPWVDSTFEVQVRTVLAEGWHEVDHDLRYKCGEDWDDKYNLSRAFNGINATLETCDWSLLNIFDQLAYQFYKERNWQSMIRHKFRVRLKKEPLSEGLRNLLNSNNHLSKKLFRSSRKNLIRSFSESDLRVPISFDNIVYIVNLMDIKDQSILDITPELIRDNFSP